MAATCRILFPFILALCMGSFLPFPALAAEAEDTDSDWYVDAEAMALIVSLPDYAPIWYGNVTTDKQGERIAIIQDPVLAPGVELTLGKKLDDDWVVEAKGGIAYMESDVSHAYNHGPWEGVCIFTPSGNYFYTATVEVDTKVDTMFRQYEASLTAGKNYQMGEVQVRPIAGYWFMEIDSRYELHWRSLNALRMKEEVSTYYNGLMAGLQLSRQRGDWTAEMEITQGLGWAYSAYQSNTETNGAHRDDLGLHKNSFVYRCRLEGGVSTQVGEGWDFAVTGGLGLLSYVPQIIASGTANGGFDLKAGPTHLGSESSVSGKLGLSLTYSF